MPRCCRLRGSRAARAQQHAPTDVVRRVLTVRRRATSPSCAAPRLSFSAPCPAIAAPRVAAHEVPAAAPVAVRRRYRQRQRFSSLIYLFRCQQRNGYH